MAIAVVGMLDEREEGLGLIRDSIEKRGYDPILIDISMGTGAIKVSLEPDISSQDLARTGGTTIDKIKEMVARDRDKATSIMSESLGVKLTELHESGKLKGIIAVGGANLTVCIAWLHLVLAEILWI